MNHKQYRKKKKGPSDHQEGVGGKTHAEMTCSVHTTARYKTETRIQKGKEVERGPSEDPNTISPDKGNQKTRGKRLHYRKGEGHPPNRC